ncbi:hypothetical protein [Streptomyces sp. NPDC091209]|uniref:hypothetical protein n=1 Tax=Streptomyces sp. NPDC091209 TaxID=3365974 RepID=UPI0038045E38
MRMTACGADGTQRTRPVIAGMRLSLGAPSHGMPAIRLLVLCAGRRSQPPAAIGSHPPLAALPGEP